MTKKKINIIIPNSLKFQLKDLNDLDFVFNNVLCQLNIYQNTKSYYSYSYIPTNSNGEIVLTKDDIIQNTELKYHFDEGLTLDESPVRFEFFVIDHGIISFLISNMKKNLNVKPDSVKSELMKRGLNNEQVMTELSKITSKHKSDKIFLEFVAQNKNIELELTEEVFKIAGHWESQTDYEYQIKM